MKSSPLIALILTAGLLAACSSGSDADKPKAAAADKALLEAAQKPLEKAGQVEQQVLDAAEAQRKQIDEQSQ